MIFGSHRHDRYRVSFSPNYKISEDNTEEERKIRYTLNRNPNRRIKEDWIHLRQGKRSGKIDDKILLEVAHSNCRRVLNEISTAKNPRIWRNEGGAKLHKHMKHGEQIDDGAEESDDDAKSEVELHTTRSADEWKIKVERIDEERDQASNEEDAVPSEDEIGIWFKNMIPPRHFPVQRKGFLKVAQTRIRNVMHFSIAKTKNMITDRDMKVFWKMNRELRRARGSFARDF